MIELAAQATRLGSPIWGVIIPAVVFAVSFVLTWLLYRHYSKRPPL